MTCADVLPWLLAVGDEGQLPEPIREHLRGCRACQAGVRQRASIDDALRNLPGPPGVESGAARFLTGRFASESGRWRFDWRIAAVAAAALLVGVGLGLLTPPRPSPSGQTQTVARVYPDEATLERDHLNRQLQLISSSDGAERVRLLSELVDELFDDAMSGTAAGSIGELPLLADLCAVGIEGLAAAVLTLPVEQRMAARDQVIANLRKQSERIAGAADERIPVLGQRLAAIAEVARVAADALAAGKAVPHRDPIPGGSPDEPRERLTTLVKQMARLAGGTNARDRAEICADVADHWSDAILFAAARGEPERAELLGRQLAEVMEQGEEANAELPPDDADRMARRGEQARKKLEDNKARAPAEAQAGLERAIQAAAKKPIPPGLRDRGKEMPPGLRDRGKGKGKKVKP